jgi:predicted lipoprotein with Yx(FWY)xxD motif
MKNAVVTFAVAAAIGLLAAGNVQAMGKKKAITGTVVDTYCLVTMNMGGKSHVKCATACAENGAPLGLKEDNTGTVYLVARHAKNMTYAPFPLQKYLEQHVTVSGTVFERDGLKMIDVDTATPVK